MNSRSLAGSKFSRIGISADKTRFERETENSLRKELKRRKDNGEDVVLFRGKVALRTDRDHMLAANQEMEDEGGAFGGEDSPAYQ